MTDCLRPATSRPALAACFAEGTDPEYMHAVMEWVSANSNPGGGPDFNTGARWTNTSFGATGVTGDPIQLSYSFPSDNLGGIGGGLTTQNQLNARMAQWFGSVAAGQALVASVFDRWSQLAGLRFVQVSDDDAPWGASGGATRGDVRIVSINIDNPGNVLAFNFFPDTGDMVIDATDGFGSGGNNFRFFRNTVSHEHGHGWGAAHVCPQNSTKLMEPGLNTNFDGPQHDDIRGANFNYGDLLENNDSAGAPSFLPLNNGQASVPTLSIDRLGDNDWIRVNLSGAGPLTVTITPTGFTYDSSTQGASCGSGNFVNSMAADLALELYSNGGATLLLSRNQNPIGQGESFTSFQIPSSGDYLLRVFAASHPTGGCQIYSLSVAHVAAACPGDANGDRIVNFADLNIVLFQFGVVGPNTPGDLNADGVVNFLDLNLVLSNFGLTC